MEQCFSALIGRGLITVLFVFLVRAVFKFMFGLLVAGVGGFVVFFYGFKMETKAGNGGGNRGYGRYVPCFLRLARRLGTDPE